MKAAWAAARKLRSWLSAQLRQLKQVDVEGDEDEVARRRRLSDAEQALCGPIERRALFLLHDLAPSARAPVTIQPITPHKRPSSVRRRMSWQRAVNKVPREEGF